MYFITRPNTYQSNIIFYEKQLATKKLSSSIARQKKNSKHLYERAFTSQVRGTTRLTWSIS